MARHAVRGCINACGVKHSARAQAIMPLLSRRPALAGPHRRGDRIRTQIAAVHESGSGTGLPSRDVCCHGEFRRITGPSSNIWKSGKG
jgi:hypothetical protein